MKKIAKVLPDDHVLGKPDAEVTIIEYADFECPYSALAAAALSEIRRIYGDRLRVIFRHFPLADVHDYAEAASFAAEAASKQGKFWEMHDQLFENHDDLGPEVLDRLAEGEKHRVDSTPTFFINGRRFDEGSDFESIHRAICSAFNAIDAAA